MQLKLIQYNYSYYKCFSSVSRETEENKLKLISFWKLSKFQMWWLCFHLLKTSQNSHFFLLGFLFCTVSVVKTRYPMFLGKLSTCLEVYMEHSFKTLVFCCSGPICGKLLRAKLFLWYREKWLDLQTSMSFCWLIMRKVVKVLQWKTNHIQERSCFIKFVRILLFLQ